MSHQWEEVCRVSSKKHYRCSICGLQKHVSNRLIFLDIVSDEKVCYSLYGDSKTFEDEITCNEVLMKSVLD